MDPFAVKIKKMRSPGAVQGLSPTEQNEISCKQTIPCEYSQVEPGEMQITFLTNIFKYNYHLYHLNAERYSDWKCT